MADPAPLLSFHGIGKTYATPVLQDIDLAVNAGEVLALAGENGAGKSTLSRIAGGLLTPSTGRMDYLGRPYAPASRRDAERLGVRMVLQELSLVPTLSIAENLFLDDLPHRFGLLDRRRLHEQALPLMHRVGLDAFDPDRPVGALSVGQQQLVEIARGLVGECRLLILDEPSAMLTGRETDLLFAQIAALKSQGVGLVYISHRLEELKQLADRIAVLRDGRLVMTAPAVGLETDDVVRAMVGREVTGSLDLGERAIGGTILDVRRISRPPAVAEASFGLKRGEILGFAGLVGSGRTELMRLLFGADRPASGELLLDGRLFNPRSPRQAVEAGVAMITEDRKEQGLLLPLAITVNTTLAHLSSVSRAGWINRPAETAVAERFRQDLQLRCRDTAQSVAELSGGNQQKVVLARWLYRDCPILILDEPTRGIDIGARYEIYGLLGRLSRQGKSLIVVSSDLRELMLLCDRIAVMSTGRLVATFDRDAFDQDAILTAAFSGHLNKPSQEQA